MRGLRASGRNEHHETCDVTTPVFTASGMKTSTSLGAHLVELLMALCRVDVQIDIITCRPSLAKMKIMQRLKV